MTAEDNGDYFAMNEAIFKHAIATTTAAFLPFTVLSRVLRRFSAENNTRRTIHGSLYATLGPANELNTRAVGNYAVFPGAIK